LIKSAINGLRISFPTSWLSAPFSLDWIDVTELSNQSSVETSRFPTQTYLKELLKNSLLEEDLDLNSFCNKCGMHPRNFQRFLAAQGTSFRRMKDELRRAFAMELLSCSDRSIAEVATQTGFSSPTAFDRAFRRWAGETPSSYRRKLGGSGRE
jgi:transcriptional regulator GlxA family with amidase domain